MYSEFVRDINMGLTAVKHAIDNITVNSLEIDENSLRDLNAIKSNLLYIEKEYASRLGSCLTEPAEISEADAIELLRGLVKETQIEFEICKNDWIGNFNANPLVALRDDYNARRLVRMHFAMSFFDLLSLNDENIRFNDIVHRFRATLEWLMESEFNIAINSNGKISGLMDAINQKWKMEMIYELLYFYGLSDYHKNRLTDFFSR